MRALAEASSSTSTRLMTRSRRPGLGDLDTAGKERVEASFLEAIRDGPDTVVVDLRNVTVVGSQGISFGALRWKQRGANTRSDLRRPAL